MSWFSRLFLRRRIYSDLSEEIQQHLTEKIEALMADGMSRDQAEFAAKRSFGNVTRIEESAREAVYSSSARQCWVSIEFRSNGFQGRQLRADVDPVHLADSKDQEWLGRTRSFRRIGMVVDDRLR